MFKRGALCAWMEGGAVDKLEKVEPRSVAVALVFVCFIASRYSPNKVHTHTHTYSQTLTDTHTTVTYSRTYTNAHTHLRRLSPPT